MPTNYTQADTRGKVSTCIHLEESACFVSFFVFCDIEQDTKDMSLRFKETFSRNISVHFLGVWLVWFPIFLRLVIDVSATGIQFPQLVFSGEPLFHLPILLPVSSVMPLPSMNAESSSFRSSRTAEIHILTMQRTQTSPMMRVTETHTTNCRQHHLLKNDSQLLQAPPLEFPKWSQRL